MAVVLLGVGADGGNVQPPPRILNDRTFEYIPIPEKASKTTETRTYGSMTQRHGEGTLADLVDGIRPNQDAEWIKDQSVIENHPVHYDPNFTDLTYGEGGKDANINSIASLGEGDILAFYTGFNTRGNMHRYLFGYFTLNRDPVIIEKDTPASDVELILGAHPANAHWKRFKGNDGLYAFDPDQPSGASRVALVDGCEPGGLLDRAVQLSNPEDTGNFYLQETLKQALHAESDYLGGFKPPIRCNIEATDFREFVDAYQ